MADFQVVLTQDDPKLGKRGDVVKVSSGFAQNFLFPHKKALLATPDSLKGFEAEKARKEKQEAERLERAQGLAKRLSATVVKVEMQAGEGDKVFGAATVQDILEGLKAQGIKVEKREIHLEEPIKRLGEFQVEVKLHAQVTANLRVHVIRKK